MITTTAPFRAMALAGFYDLPSRTEVSWDGL